MAVNLNKAGFEVIGYDAFTESREKAKAAGTTVAATLKEVAEQADDAIATMPRIHPRRRRSSVSPPTGPDNHRYEHARPGFDE
jgi:hypothetical protein